MIRRVCALGAFLALLPAVSQAALLLMVEGVPGPATLPGYTGWFNADSVAWGIERANAAAPHTLSVSLELTANLATIAQVSASNAAFKKIVVDQVSFQNGGTPQLAARLTCEEASVRAFSSSADSDDRAQIQLDIRCGKLVWENFDYTPQGQPLRTAKGSWNFKSNTP